ILPARKKKFQSARRMSRSKASASEFLMISQPCEYSSVSTRKDWGMIVPTFIMMVPAFMVHDNRVSLYVEDPAVNEKSASNRHRGSGHPLSPATPPYMRVRIRRFSSVELGHVQQPWKTERIEVSKREGGLQGRAVGQMPGTMRTAGGLSREGRSDVPLAQLSKPHLATLPLLPDHGSQPTPYPLL